MSIGYVQVADWSAKQLAEAVISQIAANRAEADEKYVADFMVRFGPRKKRWWHSRKRLVVTTREEAVKWLDANYDRVDLGWRSLRGYESLSTAKAILKMCACDTIDGTLWLSEKAVSILDRGRNLLKSREA